MRAWSSSPSTPVTSSTRSTTLSPANAEDLDGPFVCHLTALAAELDIVVVAGLLEKADDGKRVRNAVVAVGADGIRSVYRKLHLYDAFGQRESDWVEPGEISPPQTLRSTGCASGS